jgi:hypothetical protein
VPVSFVRPELVERVRPYRETLLWGGAAVVGVLLVLRGAVQGGWLAVAAGVLMAGAGGALVVTAERRRRLQGRVPEEGVVAISEARIGYLGPRGGGYVDLDGLESVEIVTDGGRAAWRLVGWDGQSLRIPIGARGAEGIYDTLAAFVALDEDTLRAALATRQTGRFPVWERLDAPPAGATLERLP